MTKQKTLFMNCHNCRFIVTLIRVFVNNSCMIRTRLDVFSEGESASAFDILSTFTCQLVVSTMDK